MLPKAIKRVDRRYSWISIGVGIGYFAWAGLVYMNLMPGYRLRLLPWHHVVFMSASFVALFGNIIVWQLHRRSIYRRAMAAGYALCDDCLYDLRETTGTCPECGKTFTPSSLRRAWLFESHPRNWFRRRE
jgi:hypothetical protein